MLNVNGSTTVVRKYVFGQTYFRTTVVDPLTLGGHAKLREAPIIVYH